MNKRSIYISIPMKGKDEAQQRRKAEYWTRHFEALGYEVINPFNIADHLKKNISLSNKRGADLRRLPERRSAPP